MSFNEGQKDGNCSIIDRFAWAYDEPEKQMFFTGGVDSESPVQDESVNAMLGAWVPNQVQMYDDGTHGDQLAGDNIYTITFDLPVGMRIGYKYLWGHSGDGWIGSEEWPGNRRLLEIDDLNGDHLVYKEDNFADQATNKDRVNYYDDPDGHTITWSTDQDGDGIPEAREQKHRDNATCTSGDWTSVTWVDPLLVTCGG